jgi:uncharacterized protein YyaL (SSP411 family)
MPDLDDKVLTAWNGMAIRAFALGAVALDREDYRTAAAQCARFVLTNLRRADGELLRSWRRGVANPTPAFLEDYALLANGLLALYEATFDPRWLLEARVLADSLLERFWDDESWRFLRYWQKSRATGHPSAGHWRQCNAERQFGGCGCAAATGADL